MIDSDIDFRDCISAKPDEAEAEEAGPITARNADFGSAEAITDLEEGTSWGKKGRTLPESL